MAVNFEECPTGILVDYIGNITVSISSDHNNEKDVSSSKPSHGAEELLFDCQTPFVNIGARNISSNYCLGSELLRKKDEVCSSKTEWRSPSPTTMNMISLEASRIVDQLHSTLETSLWEEEFPVSPTSDDESFEDCSNELEKPSQNVTLSKFCYDIEKNPCSKNENNIVEQDNLTLENQSVIDNNSVMEGNSSFSCRDNSNVKSFKENCGSTEKCTEHGIETEEAFVLLKSICASECCITTELSHVLPGKGNLIVENGKALTIENSAATETIFTLTEKGSTLAEEDSTLAEEGSTLDKAVSTFAEAVSTLAEAISTLSETGSTLTESGYVPTEERCVVVTDNCIIVEENSIIKDKYEKIGAVSEDNFSEFAEFSNSDVNPITKVLNEFHYTNIDVEQNHKLNKIVPKDKVTPLSMKSKLTKLFKTPCFKTPIKYERLEEKDNGTQQCKEKKILSEKKPLKIGQVPTNKDILSVSYSKEAVVSISKSSTLNKRISGKILFGKENKSTASVPKDQAKENLEKFDTPLKKMNLLKFQPTLPKKTSVCKSYSVVETPNAGKAIRRSNSFQTRKIPNSDQIRREKSFVVESRPKNLRMSLMQTQRIGSELQTPSKIGTYLPKSSSNTFATPFSSKVKSCAKVSQVACPSSGSALRQTKGLDQNCPQVVGFKRPASTTSKTRFASRLEQPSPLPKISNRRLFSDCNTPLKKRI